MPWSPEERAALERAQQECVGKETLFICGRRMELLRVLEMHIEDDHWGATLQRLASPERPPARIHITADGDFLQHITPDNWHFPEISERYSFEPRYLNAFKREQASRSSTPPPKEPDQNA